MTNLYNQTIKFIRNKFIENVIQRDVIYYNNYYGLLKCKMLL